ncbi:fibronectin type III domain-containing protein [Desertimonas flava]|uniref:fibronectin type III domain-containing protein n=1 Tax=Desertimonas flava TaxID=2064846 RepID=UPI000E344E56|nr:fibronectin type III domain-containing protein [Desertimonas flava]
MLGRVVTAAKILLSGTLLAGVVAVAGDTMGATGAGTTVERAPVAPSSPANDPVTLTFTANRTSAAPGDRLVFTATVANRSTTVQSLQGTIDTPPAVQLWGYSEMCAPWPGIGYVACHGLTPFELQPGERVSFFVEVFVRATADPLDLEVAARFGDLDPATLTIPVATGAEVAPQPPEDLEATWNGGESVWLQWSAPSEIGSSWITDYVVERASSPSGPWTTLFDGTYGGAVGYLGDTPPVPATDLWYRVAAVNDGGQGAFTPPVSVQPEGHLPSAPRELSLQPTGAGGELLATWRRPAYVGNAFAEYEVQLSADRGATWEPVVIEPGFTTSARLRDLRPGGRYTVRVAMRTSHGVGAWSSATATVPRRPAAPSAPRLTATTLSPTEIRLDWRPPTSTNGSDVVEYRYEISADDGATWSPGFGGDGSARSTVVAGLTDGTRYRIRVAARNSVGWSPLSNTASAVPALRRPAAPTLTATVLGPTQIRLDWTAASDGGSPILRYRYQISADRGRTWQSDVIDDPTVRSVLLDGLVSGRAYLVRIAASSELGWGATSNEVSVTPRVVPPSAPTLTFTTRTTSQVELQWTEPVSDGGSPIVEYRYEVMSMYDPTWRDGTTIDAAERSLIVDDINVFDGLSFRIAARSEIGWGAWSNVVDVPPFPPPPSAPGLIGEPWGPGEVRLTFLPPELGAEDVLGYVYEMSTDGEFWTSAGWAGAPRTTAIVTWLEPGVTYYFRAAAGSSWGQSPMSEPVAVTVGNDPRPSDPSDTEPPDSWPPDSWPPDSWPPDTWPPDTWPPDTWPHIDTWPPDTWPPDTWPPDTWPPIDSEPPVTDWPWPSEPAIGSEPESGVPDSVPN